MPKKIGLLACLLAISAPAIAADELTGADYEYLNSIGQGKDFMDDMDFSGPWKAKLHQAINDPKAIKNKKAREDAVNKVVNLFVATNLMCTTAEYRKKEPQQCQTLHSKR